MEAQILNTISGFLKSSPISYQSNCPLSLQINFGRYTGSSTIEKLIVVL